MVCGEPSVVGEVAQVLDPLVFGGDLGVGGVLAVGDPEPRHRLGLFDGLEQDAESGGDEEADV
jgi:hypothetical protein